MACELGIFLKNLFYFWGTRVWTQGFTLAMQMLYLMSHVLKPFLQFVFLFICFLLGYSEVWTQELTLLGRSSTTWTTMPALPDLFDLVILETGSQFCPGWPGPWSSCFTLPTGVGWQAHTTKLFFCWKGSCKLLPRLSWNLDLPDLCLSHKLGRQVHATMPSYWLRWSLTNFFLPRLVSNCDPPMIYFFFCGTGVWISLILARQVLYHLGHSANPSASQVARIIGVSHWHPAGFYIIFNTWKLHEIQISVPTNKIFLEYSHACRYSLWLLLCKSDTEKWPW
jgi:hypothetical protein